MKKLNLVAMSYDRNEILNALQRTNAVEIRLHAEEPSSLPCPAQGEELKSYLYALEGALQLLCQEADSYAKEQKLPVVVEKDGFAVSCEQFHNALSMREEMDALMAQINAVADRKNGAKASLLKTERALKTAYLYRALQEPFSEFSSTVKTEVRLGTVPVNAWVELQQRLPALCEAQRLQEDGELILLLVATHKSESEQTSAALSAAGFTPCPYTGEQSGAQLYLELEAQRAEAIECIAKQEQEFYALGKRAKELKLYCDYISFELEKAQLSEKLRGTERVFLMEGFSPAGSEEEIKEAIASVTNVFWCDFSEPSDGEEVPTLLKNNPVVENFEAITNMYSAPSYKEFDPNTVMAFFYSLFLGFIMADIGYGLLMMLGGGFLWWKNHVKGGGLKSLAGVFAIGGAFAFVWGFLFNSLFGISLPIPTVIPNAQTEMWSFVGINIPAVLIIAMLLGVLQLFAGYACKAAQCIRWGRIWDGLLDGGVWAIFSVGVILAILGLTEEANLPSLTTIGAITAGASLAIAVLTAGRKEKLVGKFTKGFGSLYGIINYVSDILSYARLYGLMLSGAVIAQIVSQYSVQFIQTSVPLAILGVLLMVVGHAFNLAIGLLGAYIHDARLQYVEFYGRFYEGDGELFAPIGSKHSHVWVAPHKV